MCLNIGYLFITTFCAIQGILCGEWHDVDLTLTISQCGILHETCEQTTYGDLNIHCFAPDGTSETFLANETGAREFVNSDIYNKDHDIIIYSHGYTDSFDSDLTDTLTSIFIKLNSVTFCAINATKAFSILTYTNAARNTKCVGKAGGAWLAALYKSGHSSEKLKALGHSLGGQVAGYIGREFQNITNNVQIARVSALDPAKPCFYPPTDGNKVSTIDAKQVDVYHCNQGVLGNTAVGADADFYPNCGARQAGCFTPFCSHMRCIKIYADSLSDSSNCIAVKADSCDEFIDKSFDSSETVTPGYYWDGTPGNYYYYTNTVAPYHQGAKGISGGHNDQFWNLDVLDAFTGL